MKRLFIVTLLFLIPAGRLFAVTEAIFTSVTGKVEIKGHKGHLYRVAQKEDRVVEGERILTGPAAQATLKTFDGSEIQISPNTDVWLDKLKKPDANNKIIQFKMMMGRLLATVKHLFSAQSSFEINAGGVVCAVRGTQYQVRYDPDAHTVWLDVLEGRVGATSNGKTVDYTAGSKAIYKNGVPVGVPVSNGASPKSEAAWAALRDIHEQFQLGLNSNGNRQLTDPSVAKSGVAYTGINLSASLPSQEIVP